MIVKYNSLDRLEKPKLMLCNPGSTFNNDIPSKMLGILSDHDSEEVVLNFNATSELNFRVHKISHEDPEEHENARRIYGLIQNRRLIFMEGIGYFVITNIKNGYDDDSGHYKDVKAESIDAEIQQKMLPFIADGTYRFSSDITSGVEGILETIVKVLPLWKIGAVDHKVAEKWRTFEDVDTSLNCLGFLLENVQDAYECIFVFDTVNRLINVYDQNDYVKDTNIFITKDDLINSLDITEDANDIYTAISVLGDEDVVTISPLNPLGTNVIYNFDYYLDWMSPSLKSKVSAWQHAVGEARANYYNLNLNYYKLLNSSVIIKAEIDRLYMLKDLYRRCRDNVVAASSAKNVASFNNVIAGEYGGTAIIAGQISEIKTQIDNLIKGRADATPSEISYAEAKYKARVRWMIGDHTTDPDTLPGVEDDIGCDGRLSYVEALYDNVMTQRTTAESDIKAVRDQLSLIPTSPNSYFTESEYDELCQYIFEGSYRDEYVTITDSMTYEQRFEQMKILFDRAQFQLEKVSKPTQEFDVDAENFIFIKDFAEWSDQLETGRLINVEIETDDIAKLFLSSISVNYDDHNLKLTFGNRFNKFDPKALFDDILGNISKSSNSLNYVKETLYPIKSGEFNEMKAILATSRNLSMTNALSATNQEVTIDETGYTGKSKDPDTQEYDSHEVKITSNNIVFTDDNWDSSKVAIGQIYLDGAGYQYGVNAQYLVGDVIIGNELHIKDNEGRDLLDVVDGKISSSVGSIDTRMSTLEQTATGISIRIDSLEENAGDVDHVTTSNGFTFDEDGLKIHEENSEIKNLLDHTGMYVKRTGGANGEDVDVLVANNKGVTAINLTAQRYLTIGKYSRFEDYSNGTDQQRTACFFIGVPDSNSSENASEGEGN